MTRLSPQGAERLLELVGDVNGLVGLDAFRAGLLEALQRAVPSTYASYNEVQGDEAWAVSRPALPAEATERWLALADEHPVLAHMRRTRDGRPRRISDHLDREAFSRTALYREFYAPLGIASQVAFALPAAAPTLVGIALSRGDEDFTDDEVALLHRARPHLIQAFRTAQTADRRDRTLDALVRGLAEAGRASAATTRTGEVVHADPTARDALTSGSAGAGRLDPLLRAAIAAARADVGDGRPFDLRTDRGRRLRVLPGERPGDLDLLLVDAPEARLDLERLADLGLTRREAEALRWISLGRSTSATAEAMGVAPRTVAKHLETVYSKLGVTSRSDAARTAWAAVDGAAFPR